MCDVCLPLPQRFKHVCPLRLLGNRSKILPFLLVQTDVSASVGARNSSVRLRRSCCDQLRGGEMGLVAAGALDIYWFVSFCIQEER